MNAANGDSPAESIDSSSHKYVVTSLEACGIAILTILVDSEKEHIHQHDLGHCHGPAREIATDYSSAQAHFDVLILEAGIIFHSIMIGVSLGASGGDQWIPLFIAIVFHQLFEGLALGSRIGQLVWPAGKGWKKWAMALAFGVSAGVPALGVSTTVLTGDFLLPVAHHSDRDRHRNGSPRDLQSKLGRISPLDRCPRQYLRRHPHLYRNRRVFVSRRESSDELFLSIKTESFTDAHCFRQMQFMHGSLARAGLGRVSAALFFVLAGSLCMVSQSSARLRSFSPPMSNADETSAGGPRQMGLDSLSECRAVVNRRGTGGRSARNSHP